MPHELTSRGRSLPMSCKRGVPDTFDAVGATGMFIWGCSPRGLGAESHPVGSMGEAPVGDLS